MAGYQTSKADVKVGTGQALSFQKGKGYYAKASGGARPAGGGAAATDPFAPMSGAQIANQIAGYTKRLPQPLTDPQITQRAQQTIDPLIASLTSRAQAQGKAAAGSIGGYANSVSNALGSYADSAKGIYGGAEQSQAAADAALSDALKGGGNGLADALSGKLAAIGGNTGGLVDQTRQAGVGGGNALLATGSASLANLLAHGTAAQDEAAKMPGIALRQGQSDIRDATLANNKSLADNLSGVTSQLPGIVSGLRSSNDAKATAIASAGEQVRQYETGRNDANAKFVRAEQDAGLAATTKASASTVAAQTAQANKDRSYSLEYARTFGVDPKTGQPTLAAVKAAQAADAKANKKTAGLSPSAYAGFKEKAAAAADTFYYGVAPKQHYDSATKAYTDVPNTGVPGVDYKTAISRLVTKYSLKPADAITIANEYYAPGERGRPAVVAKPTADKGFRDVTIPKGK